MGELSTSDLRRWLLGVFAGAIVIFSLFIQFPTKVNFDEFHYVPSAKQFLELRVNQNWEHPPLAKELIAIGIGCLGDRPVGWRIMSVVFGAATLAGMFFFAWVLWRRLDLCAWVTAITLSNSLLYVQSRIAMLDTFMFGFLIWGLAFFVFAWDPKLPPRLQQRGLAAAGVLLGLACACKWSAVVVWVSLLGLVGLVLLFKAWGVRFQKARESDWFSPDLFKSVRPGHWLLYLVLLPLLAYYTTFIPYFFIPGQNATLIGVLYDMQKSMYDGQLRVVGSHPYASQWWQWPLLIRPIWYAFDKEGASGQYVRGVILLGNPWIMWTGLVGVALALVSWIRGRARDAFWPIFFYAIFTFCWVAIPRKVSFYYYYYPAGMMLSLVLGHLASRLIRETGKNGRLLLWGYFGIGWGLFVYFFPILAGLRIPVGAFTRWMWFKSWI